jgi:hypothetical protein
MILRVDFKTDIFREFDIDKEVSLNEFIEIFNEHTTLKETQNSYTINSPFINMYLINGSYYLKITHFAKDAFAISLNIDGEKFGYTGKYYKDSIPKIVSAFSEYRIQDLKSYLKEKVSARKWSPIDFEVTDYTFFQKGFFRPEMIPDIIIFFAINSLLFFVSDSIFMIVITITCSFSIISHQALFYINHYKCSKNIIVIISRNELKIRIDGIEKIIKNNDIKSVVYHSQRSMTTYSDVTLKNGNIFQFSEEIFNINKIANSSLNIKTVLSNRFPYIKRPKFSDKMLD